MVPVWGEKYISVMLKSLLPSLLTPRNFPILSKEQKSTLCVITNDKSQILIKDHEIIEKCKEFLNVIIVTGDDLIDENKYSSMTRLYLLGLSIVELEDRNHIIYLTPDIFFSDGAILNILQYLDNGIKKVFVIGLRVVKDEFLLKLQRTTSNTIENDTHTLTQLALSSLHPVSQSLNVVSKRFNNAWPSHLYWIGEDVLIAHGFHWHPLMMYHSRLSIKRLIKKNLTNDYCPAIDDKAFLSEVNIKAEETLVVTDTNKIMLIELSDVDKQLSGSEPFLSTPSLYSILAWSEAHVDDFQWFLFSHKVIFSLPSSECADELIRKSNKFVDKLLTLRRYSTVMLLVRINILLHKAVRLMLIVIFQPRKVIKKMWWKFYPNHGS